MKSYTNLEQSKELVEILPIESADMSYTNNKLKKLPPYSQQVLAYSEYNPWAEMWWSERNKEYDAKFGKSGEYLILHDSNGFETLRDDGNKPIQVTHWMRIEPPAVLSSLESAEKKWEEKKGGKQ